MKRTLSLLLTLALILALAVPALAQEGAEWSYYGRSDAAVPESYTGAVSINETQVDVDGIPGAPEGYLPMRRVCEAAGLYVNWIEEEHAAIFQFEGVGIAVDLLDESITVSNEPNEDYTAYFDPRGYTYLPIGLLIELGATVDYEDGAYILFTSDYNTTPMGALARKIIQTCNMAKPMDMPLEDLRAVYGGFEEDTYDEVVAKLPAMSANASTVVIAQVKSGKMDAAKEDLQELLDLLKSNFSFYPTTAEMVNNGKIVESPDGNHLMLIISGDNDAAIELFELEYTSRER